MATACLQRSRLTNLAVEPAAIKHTSAGKLQGGLAAAARVTVLFGSSFVPGLCGVTGICTGSGPSPMEVEQAGQYHDLGDMALLQGSEIQVLLLSVALATLGTVYSSTICNQTRT